MNLTRILTLLGKEFSAGKRNFIFIFAIVVPIVITLIVSLLFGSLFLGQPKMGLADQGQSEITQKASELRGVTLKTYASDAELKAAVRDGVVEVGVLLPAGFDEMLRAGEEAPLTVYVFGESLLRSRAILATSIASLIRDVTGEPSPVVINTAIVGDAENVPWEVRLLPFIVLMTIVIGGVMIPATSLVEEKQKRTLKAITITPTTLNEVLFTKGLLGTLVSVVMGVIILTINRALGDNFALLIGVLALGGAMSAAFGVLLGAFVKDINTLFATIKGIGILLYAPALVYLFPVIPEWVGKIFPTYYMIQPVVEIAQEGGGWAEVAFEVTILVVLIVLLIAGIGLVTRKIDQFED
jgi:ABC-2 type transport system permease protein